MTEGLLGCVEVSDGLERDSDELAKRKTMVERRADAERLSTLESKGGVLPVAEETSKAEEPAGGPRDGRLAFSVTLGWACCLGDRRASGRGVQAAGTAAALPAAWRVSVETGGYALLQLPHSPSFSETSGNCASPSRYRIRRGVLLSLELPIVPRGEAVATEIWDHEGPSLSWRGSPAAPPCSCVLKDFRGTKGRR